MAWSVFRIRAALPLSDRDAGAGLLRQGWIAPGAARLGRGGREASAALRQCCSRSAAASQTPRSVAKDQWGEQYFESVAVGLTERQRAAFSSLADLLLESNAMYNLTSAKFSRQDIYAKHFADAATLLPVVQDCMGDEPPGALVDIGTGAGFPGMALSILLNRASSTAIPITLLDATAKKGNFHQLCIDHPGPLGELLAGVTSTIERAEKFGAPDGPGRSKYSMATARAVAELSVVAEYALPLLQVGGVFLACKGTGEDLDLGRGAVEELGGKVESVRHVDNGAVTAPATVPSKLVVVVRKTRETPARYPRRAGVPTKRPLSRLFPSAEQA